MADEARWLCQHVQSPYRTVWSPQTHELARIGESTIRDRAVRIGSSRQSNLQCVLRRVLAMHYRQVPARENAVLRFCSALARDRDARQKERFGWLGMDGSLVCKSLARRNRRLHRVA